MAALTESELPQAGRALRWRLASDSVLARGAAAGADGAFDEIYARYQPALVRHCRAVLLDADEAQDAAQNALTAALKALRRGTSDPVSLKAWLYRIAHNEAVALARRRADQQARRVSDDSQLELIAVAGPADDEIRRRLSDLVSDLHELPDRQRSALLLRELSGLGYDEIAGVLGTSTGASRQTVFEARAALMDMGAGRDDACASVRRVLSDGDGRVRRGRRVRAHVRTCAGCSDFVARIEARERDLAIVFPLGPVLALFGGGGAAASMAGATAAAGGGWGLGLGGAAAAIKCATVCAAAALLGAAAIEHPAITLPGSTGPAPGHRSVQVAAAPKARRRPATPIVLAGPREVLKSHATATVRHAPVPHQAQDTSVARPVAGHSEHHATAHLPAVKKPQHPSSSQSSAESVAAVTPPTVPPPTVSATASTPATPNRQYGSFIPAVAQAAISSAQQQAASAVQTAMTTAQNALAQGLALAQQMTSSAMHGFFNRGATNPSGAMSDVSSSTP